jgi:hypothetical protein
VNPIRREPILDHMRDLVQKCVDKGLLEFAFVHNLIWEYCQQCSGVQSRLNDLVTLLSDSARKLVSTKPGSRAMCVVISNSSAKDRKKVMKGLKGHVLECLLHEAAHLAVLRLIDVTDDTVNVQKLLLDEMSSTKKTIQYAADGKVTGETVPLLAVAQSAVGSKLLLRLLNASKSHLEPDEEVLFDARTIAPGTSKKTPGSRRKEHVAYLRNALVTLCSKYASVLLRCPNGSKVLLEVAGAYFPGSVLAGVVDVFGGREEVFGEEEEEEEVGMEEEEEGSSDGSGSDSEEEEEEEEDEEEEEEEEEDGNEDGDSNQGAEEEEIDDDDDDDEDEEEESTTRQLSPVTPVVVLPIEEDPVAQSTLKKLLLLQLKREDPSIGATSAAADSGRSGSADSDGVSTWETYTTAEGEALEYFPFATSLANTIASLPTEQFVTYLERNRPCFILADLLKVPSVGGDKHGASASFLPLTFSTSCASFDDSAVTRAKCLVAAYKLATAAAPPSAAAASGGGGDGGKTGISKGSKKKKYELTNVAGPLLSSQIVDRRM